VIPDELAAFLMMSTEERRELPIRRYPALFAQARKVTPANTVTALLAELVGKLPDARRQRH